MANTAFLPSGGLISFPNCSAGWQWSYNSLSQNPCEVAAYLSAMCTSSGDAVIEPIQSTSYYSNEGDDACQCTTLVYSLFSACGACQGSTWIKWSQWSYDCPEESLASNYVYTHPILDETSVPRWASLDVTIADAWNVTAAENAGDSPEVSPSSLLQNQTSSVTASAASQSSFSIHVSTTQASSTSAVSHSPFSTPSSNRNNFHEGQIVPTIVGVLGAAMLITVIFWCFWSRRRRSEEQPSPLVDNVAHMAEAGNLLVPDPGPLVPIPIHYYDPSDPSTFPPPIVLPPSPAAQTTASGENDHGTESTGTSDRTKYSGLPLV